MAKQVAEADAMQVVGQGAGEAVLELTNSFARWRPHPARGSLATSTSRKIICPLADKQRDGSERGHFDCTT